MPLSEDQKKQVSEGLTRSLAVPPPLNNDELIALAARQDRIDSAFRVVVSATTALAALYKVLSDPTANELIKKLPDRFRNVLSDVIKKVQPVFDDILKFGDPVLQKNINLLMDGAVELSYSVCELPNVSDRSTADGVAVVAGIVQRGLPFVVACVDIIGGCLKVLGGTPPDKDDPLRALCDELIKPLEENAEKRKKLYEANVEKGRQLIAQKSKPQLAAVPKAA